MTDIPKPKFKAEQLVWCPDENAHAKILQGFYDRCTATWVYVVCRADGAIFIKEETDIVGLSADFPEVPAC